MVSQVVSLAAVLDRELKEEEVDSLVAVALLEQLGLQEVALASQILEQ